MISVTFLIECASLYNNIIQWFHNSIKTVNNLKCDFIVTYYYYVYLMCFGSNV